MMCKMELLCAQEGIDERSTMMMETEDRFLAMDASLTLEVRIARALRVQKALPKE